MHQIIMMILRHGKISVLLVPLWEKSAGDLWVFPQKGQWCGALMFSLLLTGTSCWTKLTKAKFPVVLGAMAAMWRQCNDTSFWCAFILLCINYHFIAASRGLLPLTHWGRVTHICVSKLTIIGSDNGLPPDRRRAIIWTNAGILLIGPLGTNLSETLIEIHAFSFKKMHLKTSSGK